MNLKLVKTIFHGWLCRYATQVSIADYVISDTAHMHITQCENCGLIEKPNDSAVAFTKEEFNLP